MYEATIEITTPRGHKSYYFYTTNKLGIGEFYNKLREILREMELDIKQKIEIVNESFIERKEFT